MRMCSHHLFAKLFTMVPYCTFDEPRLNSYLSTRTIVRSTLPRGYARIIFTLSAVSFL